MRGRSAHTRHRRRLRLLALVLSGLTAASGLCVATTSSATTTLSVPAATVTGLNNSGATDAGTLSVTCGTSRGLHGSHTERSQLSLCHLERKGDD